VENRDKFLDDLRQIAPLCNENDLKNGPICHHTSRSLFLRQTPKYDFIAKKDPAKGNANPLMNNKNHTSELFYDCFESPLGPLWLVTGEAGLAYLIREKEEDAFLTEITRRTGLRPTKKLNQMSRWRGPLVRYFSGETIRFDAPISFLEGTPFQQKVWQTLLKIPYGSVRSYQWIGDQIGIKRAGRAIGNACGKNPIPVIIPCHRVVCQNGKLGGYTGGISIKKELLALEGVVPKKGLLSYHFLGDGESNETA